MRKTMTITPPPGKPKRRVRIITVKKGLAITTSVDFGDYAITHIRSGMKLGNFDGEANARKALGLVLPLADWTQGKKELVAKRGLGKRVAKAIEPLRFTVRLVNNSVIGEKMKKREGRCPGCGLIGCSHPMEGGLSQSEDAAIEHAPKLAEALRMSVRWHDTKGGPCWCSDGGRSPADHCDRCVIIRQALASYEAATKGGK